MAVVNLAFRGPKHLRRDLQLVVAQSDLVAQDLQCGHQHVNLLVLCLGPLLQGCRRLTRLLHGLGRRRGGRPIDFAQELRPGREGRHVEAATLAHERTLNAAPARKERA